MALKLELAGGSVLVVGLDNLNGTVLGVLDNESPARTLDSSELGVGESNQLVERTVLLNNFLVETGVLGRQLTTTLLGWCKVGPEEVVVQISATMEFDVLLQFNSLLDVTGSLGLGMLLNGGVETVDVGLVVLGVVQFVDLTRNEWLQITKVPFQVWKADFGSNGTNGHLGHTRVSGGIQSGSDGGSDERHCNFQTQLNKL
ncbi:hypothetical protein OGAPHI_004990 [Ogataea philodendri]|uniref:Uncharacterized protein n=1 Tax=Ogataea philodendri TaxID=1378263 RepID=A0A9P8T2V6_9ASCO|nr:uncharacterized protein OGAPHI_004990 [Ogataea philodendri]KAH3663589.1 hypothetical protein OGAPHI_004990 [Ogataea philodendri]